MQRLCLSVDEARAALGLGRTTVYRLISEGLLRTVTVGRRRLVPSAAIDEFLRSRLETEEPDERR